MTNVFKYNFEPLLFISLTTIFPLIIKQIYKLKMLPTYERLHTPETLVKTVVSKLAITAIGLSLKALLFTLDYGKKKST